MEYMLGPFGAVSEPSLFPWDCPGTWLELVGGVTLGSVPGTPPDDAAGTDGWPPPNWSSLGGGARSSFSWYE